MPRDMLVEAITDLPTNIDSDDAVDLLANEFGVSTQAMPIRLCALKFLS